MLAHLITDLQAALNFLSFSTLPYCFVFFEIMTSAWECVSFEKHLAPNGGGGGQQCVIKTEIQCQVQTITIKQKQNKVISGKNKNKNKGPPNT